MTEEPKAERARTFGTVSTKTTETARMRNKLKQRLRPKRKLTADYEETTIELGDLLAKLNQIDKRLKNSEEEQR